MDHSSKDGSKEAAGPASPAWIDIADRVRCALDGASLRPALPTEKLSKLGLCESPRMMFDLYCAQPGQQQKAHTHGDVDKVYVVLSGRPTVIIGGEERVLGPQQAAYAAAGVVHGVRNDGAESATLLVFQARTPK